MHRPLGGRGGDSYHEISSPGIGGDALGGSLFLETTGQLALTNCTLSSNRSAGGDGGSKSVSGMVYGIEGGKGMGGGIWANTSLADMINSTVVSNVAVGGKYSFGIGGGVSSSTNPFHLLNSIVAGNAGSTNLNATQNSISSDVNGIFSSLGHNLVGNSNGATGFVEADLLDVSASIGPLQDNGGSTLTHALLPGSPAIDAGTPLGAPGVDERGFSRPAGAGYDIGAFEFRSAYEHVWLANGKVQISFVTEPNKTYPIQTTTDFSSWQTIGNTPPTSSGQFLFEATPDLTMRFYRLLIAP